MATSETMYRCWDCGVTVHHPRPRGAANYHEHETCERCDADMRRRWAGWRLARGGKIDGAQFFPVMRPIRRVGYRRRLWDPKERAASHTVHVIEAVDKLSPNEALCGVKLAKATLGWAEGVCTDMDEHGCQSCCDLVVQRALEAGERHYQRQRALARNSGGRRADAAREEKG